MTVGGVACVLAHSPGLGRGKSREKEVILYVIRVGAVCFGIYSHMSMIKKRERYKKREKKMRGRGCVVLPVCCKFRCAYQ